MRMKKRTLKGIQQSAIEYREKIWLERHMCTRVKGRFKSGRTPDRRLCHCGKNHSDIRRR